MRMLLLSVLAVLACGSGAAAAPSLAAQWFPVDSPGSAVRVEVDLASLEYLPAGLEAQVRVSPDPSQAGAAQEYASFVALVRFRCEQQDLEPTAVAYFSGPQGSGSQVGSESVVGADGVRPGVLAVIPDGTRRSLLRAACGGGIKSAQRGPARSRWN